MSSPASAAQAQSAPLAHSDPRVPARERCVVRYLIDRWASERGDQPYVIFDGGAQWTYAQLRAKVVAVAAGLQQHGVRQGEHVLCWQPNTPDMLLTYYALNYLGAVYVPINTAYSRRRARTRHREFRRAGWPSSTPTSCRASRKCATRKARAHRRRRRPIRCRPRRCPRHCSRRLRATRAHCRPLARPIEPWDTQSIIYTSGTTGPSKGVLSSYLHMYTNPGPEAWHFVDGCRPLPGQHADVPHRRHGAQRSRCSRAAGRSCCPSASPPTRSGRWCARRRRRPCSCSA